MDTAFVDQTSYGEFAASVSNPVYAYRLTIEGMADDIVLDMARLVSTGKRRRPG